MSLLNANNSIQIREVWAHNLRAEFDLIGEVVDEYPYIGMDTEFPGFVLEPVGYFKNLSEKNFCKLKQNVDLLKLIQLGLTFSDAKGNMPTCGTDKYCIWQFNFCEFDANEDVFNSESIEMLRQYGHDFAKNNKRGCDEKRFAELLVRSGVVSNHKVSWLTFHGGYDFGYLLKLLKDQKLPETQAGFLDLIKDFFPVLYDIKHMIRYDNSGLGGGLEDVATSLKVERVGVSHQTGSDSLVTSRVFMKLRERLCSGPLDKDAGVLHGLGSEYSNRVVR